MPETIEDVLPRVFLTTIEPNYVCARVISSDETREYDVAIVLNDREGTNQPTFQPFCSCPDWRGYRPGEVGPGQYFCKHAAATLLIYRKARQ